VTILLAFNVLVVLYFLVYIPNSLSPPPSWSDTQKLKSTQAELKTSSSASPKAEGDPITRDAFVAPVEKKTRPKPRGSQSNVVQNIQKELEDDTPVVKRKLQPKTAQGIEAPRTADQKTSTNPKSNVTTPSETTTTVTHEPKTKPTKEEEDGHFLSAPKATAAQDTPSKPKEEFAGAAQMDDPKFKNRYDLHPNWDILKDSEKESLVMEKEHGRTIREVLEDIPDFTNLSEEQKKFTEENLIFYNKPGLKRLARGMKPVHGTDVTIKIGEKKTYCDLVADSNITKFSKTIYSTLSSTDSGGCMELWALKFFGWKIAKSVKGIRYSRTIGKWVDCSDPANLKPKRRLLCAPLDVAMFFMHDNGTIWGAKKNRVALSGYEFGCPGQMIDFYHGIDYTLGSKLNVARNLRTYYHAYEKRGLAHCFPEFKTMVPKTWDLTNFVQCRAFFYDVLPLAMKSKTVDYILKINNTHTGKGVKPLTKVVAQRYLRKFARGKACATKGRRSSILIQRMVKNPFLIKNKKSDSRIFNIVASTNPYMVYQSPEFYFRLGAVDFDPKGTNTYDHVTNIRVSLEYHRLGNATFDDVALSQDQMVTEMNSRGQDGLEFRKNYLEQTSRFQMHMYRIAEFFNFYRASRNTAHIAATDLLMDSNNGIHYLETNTYPDIQNNMYSVITNQSRWIPHLLTEYYNGKTPDQFDLKTELNNNELIPLIDGTKTGVDRYMGRLSQECVDAPIWDDFK